MSLSKELSRLIIQNGPISVSDFVKEALFHPKYGYYLNNNIFGREGDFITSPEISQAFGEVIAAYFINLWNERYNNQKVRLVEMGAGNGSLMRDFLTVANNISDFLEINEVSIVEISSKLKKIQQENLKEFKIDWYENFSDIERDIPIFFLSNELFDCFPIDQFVKIKNRWLEKKVNFNSLKNDFEFVVGKENYTNFVSTKIGKEKERELDTDSVFEYSHYAESFMNQLSISIFKTNGIGLIIDYGYIESNFLNSLQSVKSHNYHNVLKEIGSADITSLVNFNQLKNIALDNKLSCSVVTQNEFLQSLGIEQRRDNLCKNKNQKDKDEIISSINRLIDKDQMGEIFKCLIIWKGL